MEELDRKLFELYLSFNGPDAGPWNRSPRSLYLEYWTREFIGGRVERRPGLRVCNVGIGAGDWDNFLCDLLNGVGSLTSLDINGEICELFRYRQQREGHSNPATVVCADVMADTLPAASFDVVTVIGSTVGESGDYDRCLASCVRLVRPGGYLMYMDFYLTPAERFEEWARNRPIEILERVDDEKAGGYIFWARRTREPVQQL